MRRSALTCSLCGAAATGRWCEPCFWLRLAICQERTPDHAARVAALTAMLARMPARWPAKRSGRGKRQLGNQPGAG